MSITRMRLFADIETSPNIGMFWSAGYKLNIDYSNIIKERAIICVCYKWEGEDEWNYLTWDKNQCDKKLLESFVKIMNKADEIVGHNGDKFDWAWVRTRCLYHRIPMQPKYRTIDTLKIARSKFRLNSNRLDYIAKFLGLGEKIKTEFGLWKEILLNNSKEAMTAMVDYCGQDVVLLEKVWEQLKNHVEPKMHYGVLYESDKSGCPECGSHNVIKNGTSTTSVGTVRYHNRCKDCGKYHYKTSR